MAIVEASKYPSLCASIKTRRLYQEMGQELAPQSLAVDRSSYAEQSSRMGALATFSCRWESLNRAEEFGVYVCKRIGVFFPAGDRC